LRTLHLKFQKARTKTEGGKNPAGISQDKVENPGISFTGLIPGFFRNQNPMDFLVPGYLGISRDRDIPRTSLNETIIQACIIDFRFDVIGFEL
jgi:hypothetical protein